MFSYIKTVLPGQGQRFWFWVVLLILLSFYPYEIANAYYPFPTIGIRVTVLVAIVLTPVIFLVNQKKLPVAFVVCLAVMVIGSMLSFLVSGGHKYYYHKIIILYAAFCLIVIVYNKVGVKQFYTLYNRWILIMAVLGCVGFVLALVGVPPITSFVGLEDGRDIQSWIITFYKGASARFIRYAGFFDEPGAMGYWGCFALAINKLFIKDNRLERILLVALVFTFSLGYLLQAVVYVIFYILLGSKTSNKIAIALLSVLLIIGVYATRDTEYSYIYDESIGRVEEMFAVADVMSFEDTSRGQLVEVSKQYYKSNPVWGIGWPLDNEEYIGDNYYETLAHDGIVGTIYQYFPYILLLFWGIKRKDWELISIVVFLALAIFHRPIHPNILTYFIYYSLPLLYALKVKEEDIAKRNKNEIRLPSV